MFTVEGNSKIHISVNDCHVIPPHQQWYPNMDDWYGVFLEIKFKWFYLEAYHLTLSWLSLILSKEGRVKSTFQLQKNLSKLSSYDVCYLLKILT